MHQIRVKFFGLLPKLDELAGLLSALTGPPAHDRNAAVRPFEPAIRCDWKNWDGRIHTLRTLLPFAALAPMAANCAPQPPWYAGRAEYRLLLCSESRSVLRIQMPTCTASWFFWKILLVSDVANASTMEFSAFSYGTTSTQTRKIAFNIYPFGWVAWVVRSSIIVFWVD